MRTLHWTAVALPALALLACNPAPSTSGHGGAGGGGAAGGASDTSGGAGGTGDPAATDVVGTWIDTYVQPGKPDEARPKDSSAMVFEALVIDDAGAFTTIAGVGHQDGTFVIPGVPAGPYYLRIDDEYAWLTGRALELGERIPGRPDADWSSGGPLTLELSGLDDAAATDLWVTSANVPCWVGMAAPSGVTDASVSMGPCLLTSGDRLDVMQRGYDASPPIWRYGIVKLGSTAGVDASPGAPVSLPVALADPTPEMQQTLSLEGVAFSEVDTACALASAPCAVLDHAIVVYGRPSADFPGADRPEVLTANAPAGAADLVAPTIPFANPFASAVVRFWSRLVFTTPDPDATGATVAAAAMLEYDARIDEVTGTTLGVSLSLPRAPLVDGQSMFDNLTLATPTPMLSWTPPELGTARFYTVAIREHIPADPDTMKTLTVLRTDGTSLRVPPGRLVSGKRYRITITAEASIGDHQVSPGRGDLPRTRAPVVSGVIAVP